MSKTLYDKIWDAHLVEARPGETPLIYIDRHLIHEVTSPQAFEGLRKPGVKSGASAPSSPPPTTIRLPPAGS